MAPRDLFEYVDPPGAMRITRGSYVAVVPQGITDTDRLLDTLSLRLKFPGYFGSNWNALVDCLGDFSWIPDPCDIVLLHEDVPQILRIDLVQYIGVLDGAAHSWLPGERHKLVVGFPMSCRDEVERVLLEARAWPARTE
ncbi:MAG: barstar family protein [Phycisphaerae bacterium]|nr:barstar family protein [Phycisphaerae bacterium]